MRARPVTVRNGVCYIPLAKGMGVAMVDAGREELVRHHNWYLRKDGYVAYNKNHGGRFRTVLLHAVVLVVAKGQEVDHANGDKLDNRGSNLRPATHRENTQNRRAGSFKRAGYKGVTWVKGRSRWSARATWCGKLYGLGFHKTAEAAARAYDTFALAVFGRFAKTNAQMHGWA